MKNRFLHKKKARLLKFKIDNNNVQTMEVNTAKIKDLLKRGEEQTLKLNHAGGENEIEKTN